MNRHYKGIILSFASVMVMAITPVTNKLSLNSLTPIQASFLNALFSTVFSLLFLVFRKKRIVKLNNPYLLLIGLFNTVGILLQYFSASILDPVTIGLLGRFYIVFAVVLSVLILKEKIQQADILPIVLTIIGSFFISGFKGEFSNTMGILSAFGYTFFFALTNTFAKKGLAGTDSQMILLYNQAMSTILLFVVLLLSNQTAIDLSTGVGSIVISAFCSGFLGLLLFYESLNYITFRESNIIRTTNPLFVFLFSLPFFAIQLTSNLLIGGGLIVASIILMNLKK